MKITLLLSVLITLHCGISSKKGNNSFTSQEPASLLGKWELVKEYYDGQELFDLTDKSKLVADSITSIRKRKGNITQSDSIAIIKNIDEMLEHARKTFLEFKENGEVSVGDCYENASGVLEFFVEEGIYETDDERIRIEARHEDIPVYLGGSFRWKIQKNMLYLYRINQPKGSYRVFRRL